MEPQGLAMRRALCKGSVRLLPQPIALYLHPAWHSEPQLCSSQSLWQALYSCQMDVKRLKWSSGAPVLLVVAYAPLVQAPLRRLRTASLPKLHFTKTPAMQESSCCALQFFTHTGSSFRVLSKKMSFDMYQMWVLKSGAQARWHRDARSPALEHLASHSELWQSNACRAS